MTLYYLTPISSVFQFFTDLGIILAGGKINTYTAGTSTPQATYTDITGATPNANPLILASNGRFPSVQMWQPGGINLKIVITDSNNNQLGPTFDQISGINDPATTLSSLANPVSGSGADIVANAVRSYDLFQSARNAPVPSLTGSQTLIVIFQGGGTLVDGNGGAFRWSTTSSAADDSFSVIKPTSAGATGRYLRIQEPLVNTGLFTGTLTGMTSSTTGSVLFSTQFYPENVSTQSQTVNIYPPTITGTSNSASMTMTGMPAALYPSAQRNVLVSQVVNNGSVVMAEAVISAAGVITFNLLQSSGGFINSGAAFTNSGTKGVNAGLYISYNR